jgi:enterochelin esterase-like enzyme
LIRLNWQNKNGKTTVPKEIHKAKSAIIYNEDKFSAYSNLLKRDVSVTVYLPPNFESDQIKFPLLLLNDGQDLEKLGVKVTIERLVEEERIENLIVAGVVAGDRQQEYGVTTQQDYLKRGKQTKAYAKYITKELIPYLLYKYPVDSSAKQHGIAGCSMGGLSAMDLAWNNSDIFQKVGVFSGSFWWRKRNSSSRFYSDHRDRLMHLQIRNGKLKPGMKFWFQTGKLDEHCDRNKNGIIDSIDDTLDLIAELTKKGYRPFHDIQYFEMENGRHNVETWAEAMPEFLKWAFGKNDLTKNYYAI